MAPTSCVQIYCIPTGLRKAKGSGTHEGMFEFELDATLVFRPFSGGEKSSANSDVPEAISNWPKFFGDVLLNPESQSGLAEGANNTNAINLDIIISEYDSNGAGQKIATSQNLFIKSNINEKLILKLSDLWISLFSLNGNFHCINDVLNISNFLKDFNNLKQPNDPSYPDILSAPYAALAQYISLQRANIVKERLNNKRLIARNPPNNDDTPWLLSIKKGNFVSKDPADKPLSPDTQKQKTTQNDALKMERENIDSKLNEKLKDARDFAKNVSDAEKRSLKSCLDTAASKYRTDQAQKFSLEAVKSAITQSKNGDFQNFLTQHFAATLSDAAVAQNDKSGSVEPKSGSQNAPDYSPVDLENIGLRWQSALGLPLLQRLLLLSVDVTCTFVSASETLPKFVTVDIENKGSQSCKIRNHRSLAKVSTTAGASSLDIWPCTFEEAHTPTSSNPEQSDACGVIDQLDGLINFQQYVSSKPSEQLYRFSVDNLDVHGAADTEIQRDRAITHFLIESGTHKDNDPELSASVWSERKLRSAGVQIFDQWRDTVAIQQFVRAELALNSQNGVNPRVTGKILDADDLTIGMRLDLGKANHGTGGISWSSLCDRLITYGSYATSSGGSASSVEGLIKELLTELHTGWEARRALDGVTLSSPSRLAPKPNPDPKPGSQADNKYTVFVEPTISRWDGDPLGMRASSKSVPPAGGLPIGLSFDLPSSQNGDVNQRQSLPAKLRFGAPYWFGARMELIGGVMRPLSYAKTLYEEKYSYPPKLQLRRYLRHEWLDAPMVAAPWDYIKKEFEERRGADGKTLIVRSLGMEAKENALLAYTPEDKRRFSPDTASCYICAPSVDFNFADLHGVFDNGRGAHPEVGGLKGADYIHEFGGFPSFPVDEPPHENSIRFGNLAGQKSNPLSDIRLEAPVEKAGIAIFRAKTPANAGFKTKNPYFPDPAARYMIIALKPFYSKNILSSDPIIIPLYPQHGVQKVASTAGYPDAVPVKLIVEKFTGSNKLKDHSDIKKRTGKSTYYFADKINPSLPAAGSNLQHVVRIPLTASEDYQVLIWMAPDAAHLGTWFDLPEALACLGLPSSSNALSNKYPCIRREEVALPFNEVIEAANRLKEALHKGPIPELAACQKLRIIHAVERPTFSPDILQYIDSESQNPNLRQNETVAFRRVTSKIFAEGTTFRQQADMPHALVSVDANVAIDASAIKSIELQVWSAAPKSRPLDNPLLGRSAESRMRGYWPEESKKSKDITSPLCAVLGSRESKALSISRRLYGFDVYPDGRVKFPEETAVFSKWELPPDKEDKQTSLWDLNFLMPSKGDNSGQKSDDNVKANDKLFSDGTARRIKSRIYAVSRTAGLIPDRDIYPDQAQKELDTDRHRSAGRFAVGNLYQDFANSILRSVVRPASLPVGTILPVFAWQENYLSSAKTSSAKRTTNIRVYFDRPGFTSGIEERIGLVLWPPNILDATNSVGSPWSANDLGKGKIRSNEPSEKGADTFDMNGSSDKGPAWREPYFQDDDLGPGGAFVTRWGADPIFESGSLNWFISATAFESIPDLIENAVDSLTSDELDTGILWPEEDQYRPRFVKNVLMPLHDSEDEQQVQSAEVRAAEPKTFMMVSLLTFAPRFDPDLERWYFDFEMNPGFAPDPFLRLGLVRFQPHADRKLQVSYPTSEWVQIVGYQREAYVVLEEFNSKKRIKIIVKAPFGSQNSKENATIVLRASLIEHFATDAGYDIERAALRRAGDKDQALEPIVDEREIATNNLTESIIYFDPNEAVAPQEHHATSSKAIRKFSVFIEEMQMMRPADYPSEPSPDPNPNEHSELRTRYSGPRFAIKLAVPEF